MKKNNSIDLESKRKELLANPKTAPLMAAVSYVFNHWESIRTEQGLLPLERVLTICAQVLNVEEIFIRARGNQDNYIARLLFIGTGLLYCETSICGGKSAKFVCGNGATADSARNRFKGVFSPDRSSWPDMMEILLQCEKESGGRVLKNIKPTLNADYLTRNGAYAEKADSVWKLNAYQRSKIPKRELAWLHNNNQKKYVVAYSLDGNEMFIVAAKNKAQDEYLYTLQNFGYRFIDHKSEALFEIKKHHPLCDRCIKKFHCGFRSSQILVGGTEKSFQCFKGVEDIEGQIEPKLLTLPYYSAQ
jgi:hypothetical protein